MADSNDMLPTWGCNICFEESQNPVCTSCGHLFCWPCLYRWVHDMAKPCPVCRSSLTLHSSITPVYVTTRAEPPQAANINAAAISIPPRPHPRAPTTTSAPDHDLNSVLLYRETMNRVRQQEDLERTRLAEDEEGIARMQNIVDADARSLARMRRELKERRRRNPMLALVASSAVSGGTTAQASTRNSLAIGLGHGVMDNIDLAHGTEVIRRVLNAIVGRRLL